MGQSSPETKMLHKETCAPKPINLLPLSLGIDYLIQIRQTKNMNVWLRNRLLKKKDKKAQKDFQCKC